MMMQSRGGARARRGPRGGGPAKRDRILRAAIKIFSQKGFFNSKVSDIAQAAGVADGTIYLYFKNKDDLLISLFEEKMAEVVADVRERVAEEDGGKVSAGAERDGGPPGGVRRPRRDGARLRAVPETEIRSCRGRVRNLPPLRGGVVHDSPEQGGQDMIGFDLTQEQIALQDMARKFAANEIRPKAVEYDHAGTFPEEIFGKAFGLGLMSGYIPEEYGGGGAQGLDRRRPNR